MKLGSVRDNKSLLTCSTNISTFRTFLLMEGKLLSFAFLFAFLNLNNGDFMGFFLNFFWFLY